MQPRLKQYLDFLTSAKLVFYIMPPLMVLLVLGTVAQKEMGLYGATKLFFAGPVSWILLGTLTFCLTLKFLFASEWSYRKSGIILSHLGVLVLLYGGGLTALSQKEGYLIIPEGGSAQTVLDYHERRLVLVKEGQIVQEWSHYDFEPGLVLESPTEGQVIIEDFCLNCDIQRRDTPLENAYGMAAQVALTSKKPEKEHEANISGVTFSVGGVRYILFEGFAKPLPVEGYDIIYGKAQRSLPFRVALEDFKKQVYPGSDIAKDYRSDVRILDGEIEWPARIMMNEPLRYKGYTLFQSNYILNEDGPDSTVLAVVENQGWLFPYIGTGIMALGLLIHMIRRCMPVLIVGLIVFAASDNAHANVFDFDGLSTLPIAHDGRIKPLDRFARIYLEQFSGRTSLDGQPAIVWLSEVLFAPERALDRPTFRIVHPELRAQLGVEENKRLFSVSELEPFLNETLPQALKMLQKEDVSLSSGQQALIKLHEDVLSYTQILNSFVIFSVIQGKPYLEYLPEVADIRNRVIKVRQQKGEDLSSYSEEESDDLMLSYALDLVNSKSKNNVLLRIMPEQDEWYSPAVMVMSGAGSSENRLIVEGWRALIDAYQSQDHELWLSSVAELQGAYSSYDDVSISRLVAENLYSALPLNLIIISFYLIAFLLCLFKLPGSMVAASLGGLVHLLWGSLRIFILDRPPVGTLYESIIFVAFVVIFVSIFIEFFQKRRLVLLSGTLSSVFLLLVAPYFIQDSDSLDVLVAVLNTSFWLTTHVLCVTAGYGLCVLAAILAHAYLVRGALGYSQGDRLMLTILRVSVAGLFFTAFGTVLGGIWADQSWGRFWGWDPKENGALLIVLWLVWALHGRHAGLLGKYGFAAVIAYLNVIVTMSWFGVNLLNVGLHSYGFIEGIAGAIAAVTIIESLLIFYLRRRALSHEN